jgi:hypothetical protein
MKYEWVYKISNFKVQDAVSSRTKMMIRRTFGAAIEVTGE